MELLALSTEFFEGFLRPDIIWFLVGMGLILLEFVMPGLIVFFFGLGACTVAVVCMFAEISIEIQLLIFTITSIIYLLCLRVIMRKVFAGTQSAKNGMNDNLSEFVGEQAVVTEPITPGKRGKVEFHGTSWAAESEHTIGAETTVQIIAQSNLVLKVKPL